MTGPITPHLEITPHADGVHIKLKGAEVVVPPDMAYDIAALLTKHANAHDPLGFVLLPEEKVKGDPL